jgi:hypothetical protein
MMDLYKLDLFFSEKGQIPGCCEPGNETLNSITDVEYQSLLLISDAQ